jgi:molybdopterin-containing oxidoreductase family membrane subunit
MIMLAVVMFFTTWKMVTMTVGGTETLWVIDTLVKGPFAFNFWILEVGLGMIVPFALLMWSGGRRTGIMFIAAALMIFSFFFARLDMVVVGEIVPLYWDLGVKEYSLLNTYSPRWREILVVLGGIGFCGIAFMFGEKIFMDFSNARHTEGVESGEADNEP